MKKRETKGTKNPIPAVLRATYDARFAPHLIETQKRKGSPWESFTYTHRDDDMIDPRPHARQIKRFVSNPAAPWTVVFDIRQGVQLMMLAAGAAYAELVPLHVQYLAAMQYVSDFYGAQLCGVFDGNMRAMCIIRASHIVRDALKEAKGERESDAE